nr:phosphatidate phosphatase app1 [Quercus suber]
MLQVALDAGNQDMDLVSTAFKYRSIAYGKNKLSSMSVRAPKYVVPGNTTEPNLVIVTSSDEAFTRDSGTQFDTVCSFGAGKCLLFAQTISTITQPRSSVTVDLQSTQLQYDPETCSSTLDPSLSPSLTARARRPHILAPSWRAWLQALRSPPKRSSFLSRILSNHARERLLAFRYLYIGGLRARLKLNAQTRIHRFLLARDLHKKARSIRSAVPLSKRKAIVSRRPASENESTANQPRMAYTGPASSLGFTEDASVREPGARRKKLAGYLKAANELRQSYFAPEDSAHERESTEGPGAFPDAAVVRSGDEEMILFPSYARKHTNNRLQARVGNSDTEQEYWRRAWEQHQNENAIVDVDVRGWIYTPHRGQQTRRQRLLIGMARQLSGLPAPPATKTPESTSSSQTQSRASSPARSKQEEELILREADRIVRRGNHEGSYARRGEFSEDPSRAGEANSLDGMRSQETSPERSHQLSEGHRLSQVNNLSLEEDEDVPSITPLQKRSSWSQPSRMSAAELTVANAHLLNRLKPFMHNPLTSTPISAFFYNETDSRQHTVYTDQSGHFTCRAALDFVPTHVRVLAGEKLSATEEVLVTAPHGVSLISDIDDTIKHSAISAGAREIFRNAFIRDMSDLTIEGVREWYNTLHDMGVKIHYVSNSPWQMYPVLTSFFKSAKLPAGSFHLKQYSGMLQGIFEPVAERKKSSLDKIMRDFPDRKFILVGDSGEADLEVYTDVALDNPGRILGIFIRDVTTPVKTGYFDSAIPLGGSRPRSRNHSRHPSGDKLTASKRISRPEDIQNDDADLKAAIAASLEDMEQETRRARRSINPDTFNTMDSTIGRRDFSSQARLRPNERQNVQNARFTSSPGEEPDLIDFSDESSPQQVHLAPPIGEVHNPKSPSPSRPPKPQALRGPSPSTSSPDHHKLLPPPRPRKPSSAVRTLPQTAASQQDKQLSNVTQTQHQKPSPLSQITRQDHIAEERPPLPARPRTYRGFAKEKIANVYNAIPSSGWQTANPEGRQRPSTSTGNDSPRSFSTASTKSSEDLRSEVRPTNKGPPPPPPRRQMSGMPFSTSRRQNSNRLSGAWDDDSGSLPSSPGEAGMSRKEFMWRQRWARAQSLLERQGVTLRTWRVGSDVADICVRLVEMAEREIAKEAASKGQNSVGDRGKGAPNPSRFDERR